MWKLDDLKPGQLLRLNRTWTPDGALQALRGEIVMILELSMYEIRNTVKMTGLIRDKIKKFDLGDPEDILSFNEHFEVININKANAKVSTEGNQASPRS